MPTTRVISFGPMPTPSAAPAAEDDGVDDVTYSYVPKSRSSSAPCAPSNSTCSPRSSAAWTSSEVSVTYGASRSEEHTSELQSRQYLVCRLLLEKKKKNTKYK